MEKDSAAGRAVYEFEGFRLDTRSRVLSVPGTDRIVALTPRQFETLQLFVEHAGQLIEKTALMDALWPDSIVAENNLNQHITALRQLLGEDRAGRRFIMNVRGRGYRFVPDVMQVEPRAPASSPPGARRPPTTSLPAWQCFQQAMFLLGMDDPVQWQSAMDRLMRAVEMDPEFASALAALSQARIRMVAIDWTGSETFIEQADAEARRALSLRPDLAFTRMAAGSVAAARGDWVQAEEHYRIAATLDEDWPIVPAMHVAHVLLSMGHLRRSLSLLGSRARAHGMIGVVLVEAFAKLVAGRDSEARECMSLIKSLGGTPHQPLLANLFVKAALREQRTDEAVQLMQAALPTALRSAGAEEMVAQVMRAISDGRSRASAIDAIDRMLHGRSIETIGNPMRSHVLEWYALLGDHDRAYRYGSALLDFYRSRGTAGIFWGQLWASELREFRQDARFEGFAARAGMADYWRRFGPPDTEPD